MVLLATRSNRVKDAAEVIRSLPVRMREDRATATLTVKQQALLVGVTADTLHRLNAGSNPTQATILSCLDYLAAKG